MGCGACVSADTPLRLTQPPRRTPLRDAQRQAQLQVFPDGVITRACDMTASMTRITCVGCITVLHTGMLLLHLLGATDHCSYHPPCGYVDFQQRHIEALSLSVSVSVSVSHRLSLSPPPPPSPRAPAPLSSCGNVEPCAVLQLVLVDLPPLALDRVGYIRYTRLRLLGASPGQFPQPPIIVNIVKYTISI